MRKPDEVSVLLVFLWRFAFGCSRCSAAALHCLAQQVLDLAIEAAKFIAGPLAQLLVSPFIDSE